MAGHLRRHGQAQQVEDGRRHVGQLALVQHRPGRAAHQVLALIGTALFSLDKLNRPPVLRVQDDGVGRLQHVFNLRNRMVEQVNHRIA